jgi:DNA-binding NarL/FixJ family response regulator
MSRMRVVDALSSLMSMNHFATDPPTPSMRANSKPVLTRRQLTILAMIAEGASTEQIAAALVVSRATVRNRIAHILRRLNVHSRAHAVARAHELGLLP